MICIVRFMPFADSWLRRALLIAGKRRLLIVVVFNMEPAWPLFDFLILLGFAIDDIRLAVGPWRFMWRIMPQINYSTTSWRLCIVSKNADSHGGYGYSNWGWTKQENGRHIWMWSIGLLLIGCPTRQTDRATARWSYVHTLLAFPTGGDWRLH